MLSSSIDLVRREHRKVHTSDFARTVCHEPCGYAPRDRLWHDGSFVGSRPPPPIQKLIRFPECAHGAQDIGNPGRKQVLQKAQIVFSGG